MIYVGLFLLSAATLAFEIALTRVFSVAQFYHFAFMVVSLALLGFGASGTFLTLFPRLKEQDPDRVLVLLCWGFAFSTVGSYVLTLAVPFDSFRVALDWRQGGVLVLHYVALATPFFCSGTAISLLLAAYPKWTNRTYAANLAGSAVGCLLAVVAPSLVGGEGTVLLAAALGALAALTFQQNGTRNTQYATRAAYSVFRVAQLALILVLFLAAINPPAFLHIRLSPYKSLSYALLLPDAELVSRRWNGFSRVDVVRSDSIRSLPGRGFSCPDAPPAQLGLTVDGDDLSPISHVAPGVTDLDFTGCLLTALPYRLRPGARTLVLEPRGGLDVIVALSEGARAVTAVEANSLIIEAVRAQGVWAGDLYNDPRVTVVLEEGRAYARRTGELYDVVVLALAAPQRPVTSGAYSLAEDYGYTVEAFADYLSRLDEGGLLAMARWLQVPPSESIRAFALAVEAVERAGGDPRGSIVALRSYQQMLVLARRGPFTAEELEAVRAFAASRAFDLVYLPDVRPDEVNQYNVMEQPVYYRACVELLETQNRDAWYHVYPFDVEPPRDSRPFFGHFFKWRQAPTVLAMAGHVWQPFGGAGYFVLLALLVLATLAAGVLIMLPLVARGRAKRRREDALVAKLGYFALLGLGFLCVEIPLLQQFILFLGHPAYAMATVLFALLLFSGVGSLLSHRVGLRLVLILLPALVGGYVLGLPVLFDAALGLPLGGRLAVAVAALIPLGLLMGMPFPKGLDLLRRHAVGQTMSVDEQLTADNLVADGIVADSLVADSIVAWAWAVNGAVSVVASVLSTLLALSFGFPVVLGVGAVCYIAACAASVRLSAPRR